MNNKYLAIGIALTLLGSVVAVQYFYGWDSVVEDVEAMGKNVWVTFKEWVGVRSKNEIVIMPEKFVEDEEIIQRDTKIQDQFEKLPFLGRIIGLGERVLNRFTNESLSNIQYISNINTTKLQEEFTLAIGAGVELVSVTLSTGVEILIPLANTTRRALGEDLPEFIDKISKTFEEFFASQEIQMLIQSIIEIPQSVIMSIQEALLSFSGSSFDGLGISEKFKLAFEGV